MKSAIWTIILIIMVVGILFVIPLNITTDIDYWLDMFVTLGENELPSLTGGFEYSGGFIEGAKATAYIMTLPIRWVWYCMEQFVTIGTYLVGGGSI